MTALLGTMLGLTLFALSGVCNVLVNVISWMAPGLCVLHQETCTKLKQLKPT
jgi:hypothetical protein